MITLNVEGMRCGHCKNRVTAVIHGLDPHALVLVDLANKTIKISSINDPDQFVNAIDEIGYRVVNSIIGTRPGYGLVNVAGGCCCR